MKYTFFMFVTITLFYLPCTTARKNVLFIISDDLRPQLGSYFGTKQFPDPDAEKPYTPNLDRLAKKSLLLLRAYVQISICGPSRVSFMTGRRPDTTKIIENDVYRRTENINLTTIPQYFKDHGYKTIGIGKIFHGKGEFYDPISWTEPYYHGRLKPETKNTWWALTDEERNDAELFDDGVLEQAITSLDNISKDQTAETKPFFMAVGFWKPHLRFACPEKFFQYHPRDSITLPRKPFFPPGMPKYQWNTCTNMNSEQIKEKLGFNVTFSDDEVISLRQAYYACVSYMDNLVGKLLRNLKKMDLHQNTIVSFIGDHGWYLGENSMWCKRTNLELGLHAPMMIHIPGLTDDGIKSRKLVEFVDLFPTLVEAAGLPPMSVCPETNATHPDPLPTCREGMSLMPLITSTKPQWKNYAFSQFKPKDNSMKNPEDNMVMGYSVRDTRYRYIEWFRYNITTKETYMDQSVQNELYDHSEDQSNNINLASDENYSHIIAKCSQVIKKGWRKAHKMI